MKIQDIAQIKIMQYILKKGKVRMGGEGGIYEHFQMVLDEKDQYQNKGTWPFSPSSLFRYMHSLCNSGMIAYEGVGLNKVYYFNNDKYSVNLNLSEIEIQEIIQVLILRGEVELLEKFNQIFNKHLHNNSEKDINKKELESLKNKIGEKSIGEIKILEEEIETNIKEAIIKSRKIEVKYKDKKYKIYPIAIVKSKDKNRKYLFYARKNNMEVPLVISKITEFKLGENVIFDKTPFLKHIESLWDIQESRSINVELFFYDEMNVIESVKRDIAFRQNCKFMKVKDGYIFTDSIRGIDDFKRFIRKYSKSCIVIEPEFLRKEIIDTEKSKILKYEVEIDG